MNPGKIGIMGAMEEEISSLIDLLTDIQIDQIGGRTYYSGKLNHQDVVVVFSMWGKVAAAITVTTLIERFQIQKLIFTGVAGAIHPDLNIGDVVIGTRFVQHDMDSSPMIPKYELPLIKKTFIESSSDFNEQAAEIIQNMLEDNHLHQLISQEELDHFGISKPRLFMGEIASGDQFISDVEKKHELRTTFPNLLCVEMEGAAVAQVCDAFNVPFLIIRTISDCADNHAEINFLEFIKEVANKYSKTIVDLLVGGKAKGEGWFNASLLKG